MQDLEDLKNKAIESLRSKRRLNVRNPAALQFNDDQIAEEMQLLQAEQEELQNRQQAQARADEKAQQELTAKNDAEHSARLDKQYRNKSLGLGEKYDPKLLDHASTIFPNLKEIGLAGKPVSPQVDVERSPAVEEIEDVEESPNLTEEDTDYAPIKGNIMNTEGGWSDKKNDTPTMRGVTLATYSNYLGRPASKDELKNISDKEVDDIFKRYYNEAGGSKIKDPRVKEFFVDQNFNKGTNFLNRINDLVGTPRSSSLSQEAIDKINEMDPNELLSSLMESERQEYSDIIKNQPEKAEFAEGWDRRITKMAARFGIDLKKSSQEAEQPKTVQNIQELLKKAREEEDQASTAKDFAKLRDAIIGVGAGRVIAGDTETYDERKKRAMRPIEDMVLAQELESKQAKNDPNSQLSKLMRRSLQEMDIDMKGFENVSYAQLEKLYPAFTQALYTKLSIQAKQQTAASNAQKRLEDKKDKEQTTKEALKEKKFNEVNRRVQNVLKDDDIKLYKNTKTTDALINQAIKNWDTSGKSYKESAQAAFMGYAKAAQQDSSVVRESDMRVLSGGYNFGDLGSLVSKFAAKAQGSDFSKAELEEFKAVMKTIRDIKRSELKQRLTPIMRTIQTAEIPVDTVFDPEFVDDIFQETPDTPEERLKRYEKMINRATELQSRDTRNKKGN